MTVSQRLYLAVAPAILGVFTVAGLAYWGEYGRQAPHILVVIALVASIGSLVVAWRNTRYVATRVSRLAAPSLTSRVDELDAIEAEVERLGHAVTDAQAERGRVEAHAESSALEYAALIADTATAAARQLDEIRMPLHILLENHFGDLNDNQEEMLAAARQAADDAQIRLERLREIADADRGVLRMRFERIRLGDLVSGLLPGLVAAGARGGVRVTAHISPRLPATMGDRGRLAQALDLLTADALGRTAVGGELRIVGNDPADPRAPPGEPRRGAVGDTALEAAEMPSTSTVRLLLQHGAGPSRTTDVALADRLVAAQGGRVYHESDQTTIEMPQAGVPSGGEMSLAGRRGARS